MLKRIGFFSLIVSFLLSHTAMAQFVSQEAEQKARGSVMFSEEPQEIQIPRGPAPYTPETAFKIAIIVNGEMITAEDINSRIKAFSFNTRIPLNMDTAEMIKNRVIQNTIDEKIKLQEAAKEGIIITEKEVDDAVENFAESNKVTSDELQEALKSEGVSADVFRDQMKSDLSWLRLVRKKTAGEIEPSQKEINRAIEQLKKDSESERYMISEIVISKKTAKNLDDLVYNLRNDPRFALYAMQFSEVPSASRGGSLGWVSRDKLYPQLQNALKNMSSGDVSEPIEVNDDYYVLKLEKKYDPETDKAAIPSENEAKNMIEGKRLEEFAGNYINKLRQRAIIEIKE
ncbi:MAG: SurA N-terminal domain-containing protein [Lactobacillaceae bacterium]|jgi:peptidyl-prolyl cis-trans isomerase SurA|nr:SurA N-terminal domain-containing protein [Lactobacillaceae bacterium]